MKICNFVQTILPVTRFLPMKQIRAFIISMILLFSACHSDKSLYIPDPEKSVPPQPLTIHRYDSALFSIRPDYLKQELAPLAEQYYFFLGPDWSDTINLINLSLFINDPNIRRLSSLVQKRYADLKPLKSDLENKLSRYRSYFPEKPSPIVYTYISGLNVEMPVLFTDSAMAIGIDMFLGNDQVIYREGSIPEYKIARMTQAYIVPECMKAVAGNVIVADADDQTLLNKMITTGKVLYFLDAIFPDLADNMKIGYTTEQLEWCRVNEENIWKFLIGNQLLYNSEPAAASKLMADGPFTSGFDEQSPGRLGAWVGWQIVRAYASHNQDLSLRQIMQATRAQEILEESKYKPGR